jgi:hypothetical protein
MEIYKIMNLINGKIYVGKDTTSDKNYFGSGILIKRTIQRYGLENFVKEIIDETNDYNELSIREIYWISFYNSTDRNIGYNISNGGDGGDTLTNHPDIKNIKYKISNNNPKKGKTYEEAFGEEKAKIYKKNLSTSNKQLTKGKKIEEVYGIEKSNIIKMKMSEKSSVPMDERWSDKEKVEQHKLFLKQNISNNLLREDIKEKNLERLKKQWDTYRESYINNITQLISNVQNFGFEKYKSDLLDEIEKIPNSIFKNRKEFYAFLGKDITNEIKTFFRIKRNYINKVNNQPKYKSVTIDGINYNSITDASKELGLERSLIRYRLKSKKFTEYKYN